jgi:hypothetical protein
MPRCRAHQRPAGRQERACAGHLYGDVDPGRWYVLDTQEFKLREIVAAMPKIDPAGMHPKQTMRYAARDGLSIPAYLTRPTGSDAPAPTVVLIHGGPNVRDRWSGTTRSRCCGLRLRGLPAAVSRLHRGSAAASRMPATASGAAACRTTSPTASSTSSRKRSPIPRGVHRRGQLRAATRRCGGAIKTPTLYRCAASFAGVSDLADMLSSGWWDDSTVLSREVSRDRIGDPTRNRGALDESRRSSMRDRLRNPDLHRAWQPGPARAVLAKQGDGGRAQARRPAGGMDVVRRRRAWLFVDEVARALLHALLEFLGRHLAANPAPAGKP